jgi:hypothetical protein
MLSPLSSVVKRVGPVGAAAGATVALPLGLVCWVSVVSSCLQVVPRHMDSKTTRLTCNHVS